MRIVKIVSEPRKDGDISTARDIKLIDVETGVNLAVMCDQVDISIKPNDVVRASCQLYSSLKIEGAAATYTLQVEKKDAKGNRSVNWRRVKSITFEDGETIEL